MSDVKPEKLVGVAGEIVKIAKDSPEARAAGANVAKSLEITTRFIKNTLLPIAAVSYGMERAADYFKTKFGTDFEAKIAEIPAENLTAPKASVAGPALQGLGFSFDEDQLRELYLSLLASSVDDRVNKLVHPSFAEIIRQLDADEVELLQTSLAVTGYAATARVVLREKNVLNPNMVYLEPILSAFTDDETGEFLLDRRIPAFVHNWIRLGLVEVNFERQLSDDNAYAWADNHPWVEPHRARENDEWGIRIEHGIMQRTQFGAQFARAVGIE